jgi:uncharacterized protein (TIGR03437 family)
MPNRLSRVFGALLVTVLAFFCPCAAQTWTSIGGPTSNGLVTSIAIDPTDQLHWLVAAGAGGLWETRDSGTSWNPLTDGAPTLATGAVAFAPNDPKIIYVGTGAYEGHVVLKTGVGILKSTDAGKSWTLLAASTFARAAVKPIRIHPTNANVVLAGTSRANAGRDLNRSVPSTPPYGIQRSTDGGATWIRTLAGQITALEIDPTNFSNQYAAIGDQTSGSLHDNADNAPNGVYRSADGGQTWSLIPGPWGVSTLAKPATGRTEIAIAPSNPNVIYVSIQKLDSSGSNTLLGLYRTNNAWTASPAWTSIPTSPVTGGSCTPGGVGCSYCYDGLTGCGYVHLLSVDPSDSDSLYAGGSHDNLWHCINCGSSPAWTNIVSLLPGFGDYHTITWVGNRLITGSDHGVGSTTDRGVTWQRQNNSLRIMSTFVNGILHPTDPNVVLSGIMDVTGALRRDASCSWQQFIGKRTSEFGEAEVGMSSSRPETDWMAASPNGSGIGRTLDGGQTWTDASAGIDKSGGNYFAPVRKCPNNDNVFLTGTIRMWRTDNFFGSAPPSWVANGPILSPLIGGYLSPGTIVEIEYVPFDSGCNTYAYGNRSGQVRLTHDGGKNWTDLDPNKSLPARTVNGLAFDAANPNIAYAAISGFDETTPTTPGHVFKTTNAMAVSPTWVNVSPPLNQPFNVIRVDPKNPKLIYAGSDMGLWRSTDGATTWVHDGLQAGLPNAAIYDIQINPNTGVTAVFTYGRGAFAIGVPQAPQITFGPRSPANGATYIAGGLVPGSWAQVQGTNLSNTTRIWKDSDFASLGNNLPTKLDGVEVRVNDVSAAVYYISDTQITFQVPSGILSGPAGVVLVSSPVTVQVFRDGLGSNILTTTGTSSSPGIFPVIVNGKNYPAGVFLDGTRVGDPSIGSAFRKARPGDVIQLFATGLFRATGGVILPPQTYGDITVTIGDIRFPADAAVLVGPGEVQINFTVPKQFSTFTEADYPISIQYNGPIGTSSPLTINSDPPGPVVIPIRPN